MNWSEMKAVVKAQLALHPQPGTLSTRAWEAVEQGLRHLESQGYQFEIAPKGTLQELVELQLTPPSRTLSIAEASQAVAAPARNELSPFEAKAKPDNVTLN